jgi:hypothetical protein
MQKYENYWSLTLAYTNIHSDKFMNTLRAITYFIDNNFDREANVEYYNDLQLYVGSINGLQGTSLRKSINQFVKLGFVNSLKSYNRESIEFLSARTNRKRQTLFSKIVYRYSTFSSSITKYIEQKEINFLLKTVEEVGSLTKDNIIGLMNVDIISYSKGYLTFDELNDYTQQAIKSGFTKRKYNQVAYLFNLLKKLDDIVFMDNKLYFEDDAKVIFGEDLKQESKKRDGYLHRLYKNQLKEESEEQLGHVKCMVENLPYPSLVASHIKPFIASDDNEAYDPNNGLLLSRNMDILFDQGYISFDDKGTIIYSNQLHQEVIEEVSKYYLYDIFINNKRLKYLEYHREMVLKK